MFKSVDQIVEEGSRSYEKGIGKAFNPYSPFRPSHWSWLSGWLQARSYALEKKIEKMENNISALKAQEDILNRTIRDLSTTSALLQREVQGKTKRAVLIGPGDDDYGRKPSPFASVKRGPNGEVTYEGKSNRSTRYPVSRSGPHHVGRSSGFDTSRTSSLHDCQNDIDDELPDVGIAIAMMAMQDNVQAAQVVQRDPEPTTYCDPEPSRSRSSWSDSSSSSWSSSSSSSCDSGYSSSCDSGGGGSCGGGD